MLITSVSLCAQVNVLPRVASTNSLASSGGAGPDVWYDTTATMDGWVAVGASFMEWDSVAFAASGTVDQLRVRARGGLVDATIKVALYDNSGNLLTNGVTGTIAASSAEAWYTVSVAGAPAPAGNYKLAISASASIDVRVQVSGVGNFATQTYSGFPPATLPAPDGTLGSTFVIGAFSN